MAGGKIYLSAPRKTAVKKTPQVVLKVQPKKKRNRLRTNLLQPKTRRVRMIYGDTVQINPAAGLANYHTFRLNSLFDIDYTGVGHQPKSRDEWAAFYKTYTVCKAKVKVIFMPTSSSAVAGTPIIALKMSSSNATSLLVSNMIEDQNCRWSTLGGAYGNPGGRTLYASFDAKKFFSKKSYDDDTLGANFGFTPGEVAYLHVVVGPQDASGDVAPIDCIVQIKLDVKLTNPLDLAQS